MNKRKTSENAGFTLLELLVAIAMLAILAAIAAPSFTSYMATNNVFSHKQDVNSAIVTARTEALNRNKTITVCPSSNAASCSGSWSDGWIIFQDDGDGGGNARNGALDGGERLINAFEYTGTNTISISDVDTATDINFLSFNEQGRPAIAGVQTSRRVLITVCDRTNAANLARGMLLTGSGRLIQTRDTNNDGIHESRFASGTGALDVNNNLSCN